MVNKKKETCKRCGEPLYTQASFMHGAYKFCRNVNCVRLGRIADNVKKMLA